MRKSRYRDSQIDRSPKLRAATVMSLPPTLMR